MRFHDSTKRFHNKADCPTEGQDGYKLIHGWYAGVLVRSTDGGETFWGINTGRNGNLTCEYNPEYVRGRTVH